MNFLKIDMNQLSCEYRDEVDAGVARRPTIAIMAARSDRILFSGADRESCGQISVPVAGFRPRAL